MAVVLLFLLQNMLRLSHHVVWISGLGYVVVLVARTVFVELGIRRPLSSRETQIEERGRKALRRNLGIVLLEDTSEGDSNGGGETEASTYGA